MKQLRSVLPAVLLVLGLVVTAALSGCGGPRVVPVANTISSDYPWSTERDASFRQLYEPASQRITEALVAGRLGETVASGAVAGQPRPDGYTGWGQLSTRPDNKTQASVALFWRSDGTPDLSKGFNELWLDPDDTQPGVRITPEKDGDPWYVQLHVDNRSDGTAVNRVTDVKRATGLTPPLGPDSGSDPTDTLSELRELDLDAITVLEVNMNRILGPGWRN
ncbi:hypothetical protein JNJ66_02670 [Candidatus Saccharibacteria bacterium]|nr:hypothetical protein [Candidatus Saccharibacteria bacterium]